KANIHARVHRRVYLDYIGIKHFDASGNLLGEQRIVGLFTSTAYTRAAHGIPYLRRKLAAVESRAGFDPGSHSGKALTNVLEHYPRDELFQVDEDTLYRNAIAILQLGERPRVRVLVRRDRFDRFVSVLVFVPRERYDSAVRARIADYLADAFIGRVSAFYPYFPEEGPLVRVHFIIGRSGGPAPRPERATLEREVEAIIRTWADGLCDALALSHPPGEARTLFERYRQAFSEGFHEAYAPQVAAGDIRTLESLTDKHPLGVDFHHRQEEDQRSAGLKVWSLARPLPLSERVPVLENMGFRVVDERTYHIATAGDGVWFHDMLLQERDGGAIDLGERKDKLEAGFLAVMRGRACLARRRAHPHAVALPAPDPCAVFAGLHVGDARQARRHRRRGGRAVPRPLRSKGRRARARVDRKRHRGAHRGAIAGGRKPRRRPYPAPFRQCRAVGAAHQFLPARHGRRAQAADRGQVRQRQAHRPAVAAPALRDFRLFAARRRRAPALRQSGARRHPLVGPAAGFPHRDFGAGEGAAGQERGDRAGRRQRRLRAQADAEVSDARAISGGRCRHLQAIHRDVARHHRQYRARRQDHPACGCRAARRRRSLSGGRRRQGHRHLLRHRQRDLGRPRLLAGRRLRLRRLGRLRPQGHGHHRARRLGGGEAALPRDGRRYRRNAVHRRRRRRHVRRRFRQWHAARAHHQADRRLRPPRHFHRSRPRPEDKLRRAQTPVRSAALELAGLRQGADLKGRRRLFAQGQGNPAERGSAKAVRRR